MWKQMEGRNRALLLEVSSIALAATELLVRCRFLTSCSCSMETEVDIPLAFLLFSCQVMSDSSQPHGLQHTRLPCPHHLPEFAQVHVHWVSDAIQPSHPLSPLSPHTLNLSQHRGPFQWVGSSHQVAKVLELQLQYQSFQWIFRVDFI